MMKPLENKNVSKKYKNKLIHSLRNAKRCYYEKKLEQSKSNMKSTWNILNEVLNRKKRIDKLPSAFTIDNKDISNPMEIATRFCDYFRNPLAVLDIFLVGFCVSTNVKLLH